MPADAVGHRFGDRAQSEPTGTNGAAMIESMGLSPTGQALSVIAFVLLGAVILYVGLMFLIASAAVAFGELATRLSVPALDRLSFILPIGPALLVCAAILFTASSRSAKTPSSHWSRTDRSARNGPATPSARRSTR